MALKLKSVYICRECGYQSPKWNGRCPACQEWNTFEEEVVESGGNKGKSNSAVLPSDADRPQSLTEIDTQDEHRYYTGISELDRVLGGGLVKGSLVLLGGDPGIGKSTLLLQICNFLCKNLKVLYISGEESVRQIKLRANRLGVDSNNLFLISQTNIETIANTITIHSPDIVMVDSIQTMSLNSISSSPGSVTQVRECTSVLMKLSKSLDIPIFIVGHVNKDGAIAGPKVLEHIVDAVLYFEGERNLSYRVLRAVKNRFGSTNEIGVFEMCSNGLNEVTNPSEMLLSGRPVGVSGTCVACVMEGTRPILAEVQALVTKTSLGTPRRVSTGVDYNRISLVLAVLEKRAGYFFSTLDTYVNVVGGLKLDEPAADLAIAIALVSSLRDKPVSEGIIAFGELGLAGELRAVSNIEDRIKEAQKLGFNKCIIPKQSYDKVKDQFSGNIRLVGASFIRDALSHLND